MKIHVGFGLFFTAVAIYVLFVGYYFVCHPEELGHPAAAMFMVGVVFTTSTLFAYNSFTTKSRTKKTEENGRVN